MRDKQIRLKKGSAILFLLWFFSGILFSILLSSQTEFSIFTISLFSSFEPYVSDYEKFCWSIAFYIVSLPMFFLFIRSQVIVDPPLSIEKRMIFFLLIPCFLLAGLGLIPLTEQGMYTQLLRRLIQVADWVGAVLLVFFSFSLVTIFLSITFRKMKGEISE
ncbi:hypothetical protein [Endozoicomonas sp. ALB115]|uniref:hypothetical protein n=1 Tax=Endozoicomonas TaxID=305899 RepID=UPI003BB78CD6